MTVLLIHEGIKVKVTLVSFPEIDRFIADERLND